MSSVVDRFSEALQHCGDAIQIERQFHEMLRSTDSSMLFAAEHALLKLASYNRSSAGIFYAAFFAHENDSIVYVR